MPAYATFGSPIKKLYGETVALTTTAAHLLTMPNYHEVMFYCASAWRLGLAPKLSSVKLFSTTYTDYTSQAIDRVSTTHVPLDAMTTAKYLYLGVTEPVRGFYINVATNVNAVPATLDWEYCYDISGWSSNNLFLKIEGTVSAALVVGETVTGATSVATATLVADDGATYIIVKDVAGAGFKIGETINGAAQNISLVTAINPVVKGTAYFTDVASDSDGTDSPAGTTLGVAGLYSFTLPAVKRGAIAGINGEPLFWYRFKPSTTLSATVDLVDIIPACDTVNYAFMEGGTSYQFSVNQAGVGAFEFDHTATGTLDVSWIAH